MMQTESCTFCDRGFYCSDERTGFKRYKKRLLYILHVFLCACTVVVVACFSQCMLGKAPASCDTVFSALSLASAAACYLSITWRNHTSWCDWARCCQAALIHAQTECWEESRVKQQTALRAGDSKDTMIEINRSRTRKQADTIMCRQAGTLIGQTDC